MAKYRNWLYSAPLIPTPVLPFEGGILSPLPVWGMKGKALDLKPPSIKDSFHRASLRSKKAWSNQLWGKKLARGQLPRQSVKQQIQEKQVPEISN